MAGGRLGIPLFPLGLVLLPGVLLPLNIFEPRYRQLVADLQARPDPVDRQFGVVAIRHGREVGADTVDSLYTVGTLATVTRVQDHPDGRQEILTVGTQRFALCELDHSKPYLQGEVVLLGDPLGEPAAARAAAGSVLAAFRAYLAALGASRGIAIEVPELPADPQLLSWLVAATVVVDLSVRQQLLEAQTTAARLADEQALLRTEIGLLSTVAAAPAPELTRLPQSPN